MNGEEARPPGGMLDQATAASLASALGPVDALAARLGSVVGNPPPGSLHDLDCRRPLGRFVHELAHAALSVSVDHLLGLQAMLRSAHPVYSHMTLLRGALETACLGRWLLDPSASSAERVTRGVAAQVEDFDQRRKFEAAASIDRLPRPSPGRSGAQRRDEVEAQRDANGIPTRRVPESLRLPPRGRAGLRHRLPDHHGGHLLVRSAVPRARGREARGTAAAPSTTSPGSPRRRRCPQASR